MWRHTIDGMSHARMRIMASGDRQSLASSIIDRPATVAMQAMVRILAASKDLVT
jgi:hypothetical protein